MVNHYRLFCALAVWLVIVCLIGAFARSSIGSLPLVAHMVLLAFMFAIFLWIGLLVVSLLQEIYFENFFKNLEILSEFKSNNFNP